MLNSVSNAAPPVGLNNLDCTYYPIVCDANDNVLLIKLLLGRKGQSQLRTNSVEESRIQNDAKVQKGSYDRKACRTKDAQH